MASTRWLDSHAYRIPGRDYVQHIHTWIKSLPSKIRTTTRGLRREAAQTRCRAGCSVTETAAHIIQQCHRTHGGRILRHNGIVKTTADVLRKKNYMVVVVVEPVIPTREGNRKPDLVCIRHNVAAVIDAQVVSATSLDRAHENKVKYYRDNVDVAFKISEIFNVDIEEIRFTSATVSWRGIWAKRSAQDLLALGVTQSVLSGITTRTLQGSHTNWTRFNKMTTMRSGPPRTGVG